MSMKTVLQNYDRCKKCEHFVHGECGNDSDCDTRYFFQYGEWHTACIDMIDTLAQDDLIHWCDDDYDAGYYADGECRYLFRYGWCSNAEIERDYYECPECGQLTHYEDFDEEECCCRYCVDSADGIERYHANKGHFKPLVSAPWYIGAEMEVEQCGTTSRYRMARKLLKSYGKYIVIEHDSSLDYGMEIITQPLSIEQWLDNSLFDLNGLCEELELNNFASMDTCGLHVHVSRDIFGDDPTEQELALYRLIRFYNEHFETMFDLSRRDGWRYVESWADCDRVYTEDETALYVEKTLEEKDYARYRAVNTTNDDTVEFRLAHGETEPHLIRAWIDIHVTLCLNARRDDLGYYDIASWFEGISEETKSYLVKNGFSGLVKGGIEECV